MYIIFKYYINMNGRKIWVVAKYGWSHHMGSTIINLLFIMLGYNVINFLMINKYFY